MTQYMDISGRSGIEGYDLFDDAITVYFKDGREYNYTELSAGKYEVDQMKQLAEQGTGLNAYINKITKFSYE
jgi:hypothetical protein